MEAEIGLFQSTTPLACALTKHTPTWFAICTTATPEFLGKRSDRSTFGSDMSTRGSCWECVILQVSDAPRPLLLKASAMVVV